MSFSFLTLSSDQLHNRILKDISGLLKTCRYEGLEPLYLIVGPIFVEVTCTQVIIDELGGHSLEDILETNCSDLSEMFNKLKLKYYSNCEGNLGIFDSNSGVTVFFDPDQSYLELHAVNPKKKAAKGECKVGSGHLVVTLSADVVSLFEDFKYTKTQS